MKKVAVFIDWENLRLSISAIQKRNLDFRDKFNYNCVENVLALVYSFLHFAEEEIYRIYFYTAEPLNLAKEVKKSKNKDYMKIYQESLEQNAKVGERNKKIKEFISEIGKREYVALRLGELKFNGYNQDKKPEIKQKMVDMLIGLDISHIAYNKLADRVLVFCKDTDIIPAIKCARRNGLRVDIAHIHGGFKISDKIRIHSDLVRSKQPEEIVKDLAKLNGLLSSF